MSDNEPVGEMEKQAAKKKWTHEERIELAAKLDQELDDFINGLEKRRYTEGWPEDRWEQEMEKHPFFMTQVPEDGSKMSPLLEGIQQLKYDENENTPLELAISYKDDGNFNYKYKKYRMAILSYTEGIKRLCGDETVQSQLYSNRAAAQFHLKNYRSCLADCNQALKIKPDYEKARIKAAECCVKLKLFNEALVHCDEVLRNNPTHENMLKIRKDAVNSQKIDQRNQRKEALQEKKLRSEIGALKAAIEQRNIKMEIKGDIEDSLEIALEKPKLDGTRLSWPVFFLYPEYSMSDYVEEFNENSTFQEHLEEMFSTPPQWDRVREYRPDVLNVYFEGWDRTHLYLVDVRNTLCEVLSSGRFVLRDWKPSFLILVRGSSSERNFLKNYTLMK